MLCVEIGPCPFKYTRGTFRQVPKRRIRLSFVECAYSDLRDIYIYFFFFSGFLDDFE